jgi:hypothetical protein
MALSQKYLERLGRRLAQEKNTPKTVSPQQMARVEGVLFGSPDALLSAGDVILAFRLVAEQLQIPMQQSNPFGSMRAGALRKLFRERFGHVEAEQAMVALWRSTPREAGTPVPNEDQSQASPGVRDCPRSMPAWRREFHQEVSQEQRLLESMGGWCG